MAIFRDREMIEENVKFPGITDRYNEEVVKFIEEQSKDQPFFIYMAHQIAHTPIAPSKPFLGKSKEGKYADFVTELDHSVGEVLQALRDNGLDDNTLVVFLADNGHHGKQGSGGPLAGSKYTTMEGGHRVAGIFRWPGTIPAGQVSDVTLSSMDLLPLFCDLADVELPTDRTLDGKNILDVLLGQTEESPHQWLYYYNGHNLQAVRKGKWKLHLPRTAADQPYWGQVSVKRSFVTLDQPFLVNLETDIGEQHNVAADNPEVVDTFLKEAERIRTELGDVGQTGSDQRALWRPANSKLNEPEKNSRPAPQSLKKKSRSTAASKTDATPSERSASFDFESGKLEPWKVVEGSFGHLIGNRDEFFAGNGEFNKQGNYYLTTLEISPDGARTDQQTGVIVSPLFIPKVGNMTFRVGGGGGESTYVALCTADGKEVEQARGINSHVMQRASWDLTPYIGKKMFIKIVDQSTGRWGHITADHFELDAEL